MAGYFDFATTQVKCDRCGWAGRGEQTLEDEEIASGSGYLYACPRCGFLIGVCRYPTLEELRANQDRLSEKDRQGMDRIETRLERFEAVKLNDPRLLPDIESGSFVVEWAIEVDDDGEHWTLLRQNGRLLWCEIAFYEGAWRFVEVALLLKQRYGRALREIGRAHV